MRVVRAAETQCPSSREGDGQVVRVVCRDVCIDPLISILPIWVFFIFIDLYIKISISSPLLQEILILL